MTKITKLYRVMGSSWVNFAAFLALVVFAVVGIAAPLLSPIDPNLQDLSIRLLPPLSDGHLLGTDLLGRDVLSRLIHGTQVSLIVGFAAVLFSGIIGIAVGLVSAYFGGWIDTVLMRIVDAWLAFPFLLLAIAVVAVLGPGLTNIVIALVVTGWVTYARLVRAEALSLREREFVLASKGLGASHITLMLKHILPNIFPSVLVVATLELGVAIVTEASLSFLGLGASASEPSWGAMLADGRAYIANAWWLATLPGLAIFLVVLAVNMVGDSIRDALDPRLQTLIVKRPRGDKSRPLPVAAPGGELQPTSRSIT